MKSPLHPIMATCVAFAASFQLAPAALVFSAGYSGITQYTHAGGDNIVSFDRGADGALYYMTSNGLLGGVYRHDGISSSTLLAGSGTLFPGASVTAGGNYVYFNTSDFSNNQNIHRHEVGGSGSSIISTTSNYSLLVSSGGDLFIAGSGSSSNNHIYYTGLDASGNLISDPAIDLGGTGTGYSGALAFDAAGNLFYAAGFGDLSIYRWSAAEVAAAIADPLAAPLSISGALWLDYSGDYGLVSGGTSMVFDANGNLVVTLTDYFNPSYLVELAVDENGDFAGLTEILESSERLGEVRFIDGQLWLADENQIIAIVPEPGSVLLSVVGLALAFGIRRRA